MSLSLIDSMASNACRQIESMVDKESIEETALLKGDLTQAVTISVVLDPVTGSFDLMLRFWSEFWFEFWLRYV